MDLVIVWKVIEFLTTIAFLFIVNRIIDFSRIYIQEVKISYLKRRYWKMLGNIGIVVLCISCIGVIFLCTVLIWDMTSIFKLF